MRPSELAPIFAVLAAAAFAQSTVTNYTADLVNGGFDATSTSNSSDHTQSQLSRSIDGRLVPVEQHEERVIRSDASGSVKETIVRHYDATGQLASTDRTVTETRNAGNGGSTARATVYRSDLNGGEQLVEQRTVDTRVSGSTTTANTVVDRRTPDGTFQTMEKQVDVTQKESDKSTKTTQSVFRRSDPSQDFREANRKVITNTHTGSQTVEDTTEYGPGANVGDLQFQERRVSTAVTAKDGSQTTSVDVYAPAADGHVQGFATTPQLKQEQIITHVKKPDGSVVETFGIREPSVSDAAHLGDYREITQSVCTGQCSPVVTPAPVTPAPATTATAAKAKP